jgi:hypothetical protein
MYNPERPANERSHYYDSHDERGPAADSDVRRGGEYDAALANVVPTGLGRDCHASGGGCRHGGFVMEVRIIRPDEWDLLKPIFAEHGARCPEPSNATAAVAIDEQGLAGFFILQRVWHAEPMWIRPDRRGRWLWKKLHAVIDGLFKGSHGNGYYSFSTTPMVDAIAGRLGYRKMPDRVWKREFS